MRRARLLITASVAVISLVGCTARANGDTDTAPPPPSSIAITGSTDELLDRLVTTVGQISEAIIGDGDQQALLVEAEAVWAAARPALETADSAAAASIQTLMDQTRVAVERKRPADADKATKFLTDVVASVTTS